MSEASQSGAPCPSCGVVVAAGYVKCPRCHVALKGAASARAKRISMHGGATSIQSDGSALVAWILGGGLLLVIGAVVFLLMRGGGQVGTAEPPPSVRPNDGPTTRSGLSPTGSDQTPPAGTSESAAIDDGVVTAAEALRKLESELQSRRLWATVGSDPRDPATAVVQSGQCEDEAIDDAIEAARSQLKQAAFTALRCVAQHGTDVFQIRL